MARARAPAGTRQAKDAMAMAADGNSEELTRWAKNHPSEFFTRFFVKTLDAQMSAQARVPAHHEDAAATLAAIIKARRHELKDAALLIEPDGPAITHDATPSPHDHD